MREQFEKLPDITNSLSQHIYFSDDNLYHSDLINFQKLVCWINGAWYAFQEQQKIIDMQECGATEIQMILDDNEYNDATRLERIRELLK